MKTRSPPPPISPPPNKALRPAGRVGEYGSASKVIRAAPALANRHDKGHRHWASTRCGALIQVKPPGANDPAEELARKSFRHCASIVSQNDQTATRQIQPTLQG